VSFLEFCFLIFPLSPSYDTAGTSQLPFRSFLAIFPDTLRSHELWCPLVVAADLPGLLPIYPSTTANPGPLRRSPTCAQRKIRSTLPKAEPYPAPLRAPVLYLRPCLQLDGPTRWPSSLSFSPAFLYSPSPPFKFRSPNDFSAFALLDHAPVFPTPPLSPVGSVGQASPFFALYTFHGLSQLPRACRSHPSVRIFQESHDCVRLGALPLTLLFQHFDKTYLFFRPVPPIPLHLSTVISFFLPLTTFLLPASRMSPFSLRPSLMSVFQSGLVIDLSFPRVFFAFIFCITLHSESSFLFFPPPVVVMSPTTPVIDSRPTKRNTPPPHTKFPLPVLSSAFYSSDVALSSSLTTEGPSVSTDRLRVPPP